MSASPRVLITLAGPVVACLVALAGCSPAQENVRDDTGAIAEANENASVFDMRVGDCFDDPGEAEEVETLPAVPCGEAHDFEVYDAIDVEGDDFPGDDALTTQAEDGCAASFEDFVGTAYEDSALEFTYLTPTADTWTMDDRAITCLLGDPEAQTTGTLEGAQR